VDQTGELLDICASVITNAAVDWEYFTIDNDHFLAIANATNDLTHNIGSVIYKINF
jgi:hypothetical protein